MRGFAPRLTRRGSNCGRFTVSERQLMANKQPDGVKHLSSPAEPKLVSITNNLKIDHTNEYEYRKLVDEEIIDFEQVEVTEDLRLGGIHDQKAWRYWFDYLTERAGTSNFIHPIVPHAMA